MGESNPLVTLWRNAFGSDELTHYTAEYTWFSNQMAHAMMGFCLAVCWVLFWVNFHGKKEADLEWGLSKWLHARPLDLYVVLLLAAIPVKEVVDIVSDAGQYRGGGVKANFNALLIDSVTDTLFWWSGMFLATAIIGLFVVGGWYRAGIPAVAFVVCLGLGAWLGQVWVNQKRTFDWSGMPFNYQRLPVLAANQTVAFAPTSPNEWAAIERFRAAAVAAPDVPPDPDPRPPAAHYVVFGGRPEDRTALAVSMGCEYAFKLRFADRAARGSQLTRVLYVSAAAAMERPERFDPFTDGRLECVVIDDLDVATLPPFQVVRRLREKQIQQSGGKPVLESAEKLRRYGASSLAAKAGPAPPGTSPAVEVTAADLADAERQVSGPAATPEARALEARRGVFVKLGGRARAGRVTTIWVLSGYAGGDDPEARRVWAENRTTWVRVIAEILGEEEKNLTVFELAGPTRQAPPTTTQGNP